jgi:predicted  nucleic acid-binding Zn-ribbon protein
LYLSQNKNQFINLKREQMQTKAPKTELQEELKEQLLCVIEDLDKDFDRLNRLKDEDPKFMVKLHNLCERVEDTLASYRMDFGYQKMDLYKDINS